MASPPGFEAKILRELPALILAGTVPPAAAAFVLQDGPSALLALAMIVAWWLGLVPVAIGCLIVTVMKGPPRTADSYPLPP